MEEEMKTVISIDEECIQEASTFDEYFRNELQWLTQSGIFLVDYTIVSENESEIDVEATFDINEELLRKAYETRCEMDEGFSVCQAFEKEFEWVEESGITLKY